MNMKSNSVTPADPTSSDTRPQAARVLAAWIMTTSIALAVVIDASFGVKLAFVTLAAITVGTRTSLGVYGTTLVFLGHRFDFTYFGQYPVTRISVLEPLLVGLFLLLLGTSLHYIHLLPRGRQSSLDLLRSEGQPYVTTGPLSMLRGLAVPVPLCIVLALLLLAQFSESAFRPNPIRFAPVPLRAVVMLWLVGSVALLLSTFFSIFATRRWTAEQARMYVQGELEREIGKEQNLLERARGKQRARPSN